MKRLKKQGKKCKRKASKKNKWLRLEKRTLIGTHNHSMHKRKNLQKEK